MGVTIYFRSTSFSDEEKILIQSIIKPTIYKKLILELQNISKLQNYRGDPRDNKDLASYFKKAGFIGLGRAWNNHAWTDGFISIRVKATPEFTVEILKYPPHDGFDFLSKENVLAKLLFKDEMILFIPPRHGDRWSLMPNKIIAEIMGQSHKKLKSFGIRKKGRDGKEYCDTYKVTNHNLFFDSRYHDSKEYIEELTKSLIKKWKGI